MTFPGEKAARIKPRIIIHGGAGNVTHENVPPDRQETYRNSLLSKLRAGQLMLDDGHQALDVATHVVTLFEDDELYNASRGAVFTRAGTIELEASVMVSQGYRKRGVGCMRLTRVKNPIRLAREMLVRGEDSDGKGGGAYAHSQISGEEMEALAEKWGLEMVDPKYFWTQKRWDEHKRGLREETEAHHPNRRSINLLGHSSQETLLDDAPWQGTHEALPQGTVGAVVLDACGTLCVATSTGGLTNKLPGRIGDTPTLGAGFWAEQWEFHYPQVSAVALRTPHEAFSSFFASIWTTISNWISPTQAIRRKSVMACGGGLSSRAKRAVAMSGTGNGDSFLRVNAVRTAAAMVRFSNPSRKVSLAEAIARVAGPGGELQQSAEDRWGSGEGEGGIIGIELIEGQGKIAWDLNCGGMFRAWVDDAGLERCLIFATH